MKTVEKLKELLKKLEKSASKNPSATFTVGHGSGSEFATIQAAIDAATPGDIIQVEPGDYNEVLTVKDDIFLVGKI